MTAAKARLPRPGRLGVKPIPHLALHHEEGAVLDEIDAQLLRIISESNSLSNAAKSVGISYRNAWGRVKKVEKQIGSPILRTRSGGSTGGGSVLTPEGASLLKEYGNVRTYLLDALGERESAGNVRYKLSARNTVTAKVTNVERGDITSMVRMTSITPINLTSIISNEAVDYLDLRDGDTVEAVIKSTEVMIAKPEGPPVEEVNSGKRKA